ncbi:MAG: hypothetical protein H7328_01425 [Bdellovibrio sp.]|nr:hypothetical protein [Bdellovibrio sp.]
MSRAVIDQPGPRIVIVGLIMSFILGFALKSQTAPEKIQKHLQKAVSRLEKDFTIDFEGANVNLSNWGLPWPRLEINRVRLSPRKNICQSSQIFIDQIEIPISWTALLFSQTTVDTVRAHNVELRIADLDNCIVDSEPVKATAKSVLVKSDSAKPEMIAAENLFQKKTSSLLKNIYVDQLKIIVKNQYQQPLILRQLNVNLEYSRETLSQINIKSRLLALNDPKSDVFYFGGDLTSSVKAIDKQDFEVQLNLKGRMLDGDLQIFSQFSSLSKNLNYEIKAKKISVKAFLPLVKLNGFEAVFDRWPINLSFDLTGQTKSLNSDAVSTAKINKIELSGERTHVVIDQMNFEFKKTVFELQPFTAQIDHLPLNQFKYLATLKSDLNSFEDLGDIKAQVQFTNPKNWTMDGILTGTNLIFSNRGTRELQKIDSIQMHSTQKNEQHDLLLTEFKVNSQEIKGQMEAHFNQKNNALTAKMDITGILLNAKIWKQLTQIEQAPEIKMTWSYHKTADLRQQVFLSAPEVQFEGFSFKDLQIDFIQASGGENQSLALTMKSKEAEIQVANLTYAAASGLFNENSGLQGANYQARKLHLNLKGSDWKNMNFDFEMGLHNSEDEKQSAQLRVKGNWKNDAILNSTALLQNGANLIKYDITKTAEDEILLVPVSK